MGAFEMLGWVIATCIAVVLLTVTIAVVVAALKALFRPSRVTRTRVFDGKANR